LQVHNGGPDGWKKISTAGFNPLFIREKLQAEAIPEELLDSFYCFNPLFIREKLQVS